VTTDSAVEMAIVVTTDSAVATTAITMLATTIGMMAVVLATIAPPKTGVLTIITTTGILALGIVRVINIGTTTDVTTDTFGTVVVAFCLVQELTETITGNLSMVTPTALMVGK